MVLPSLRLWLQSTSLLAVLAGYALLLVLNQALSQAQRVKAHKELVSQIAGSIQWTAVAGSRLTARVGVAGPPGVQVELLRDGVVSAPQLELSGGRRWLVSVSTLPGEPFGLRSLRVRQDVTSGVESHRAAQGLLIAAAGLSTLLTSGLLRLVLRRGLVQPLDELSDQIQALQPPPAPSPVLLVAQQPQELKPIAAAFNAMQARLGESWERQRLFVDGLAHELRTPLTLISGRAQSLQRHGGAAAQPELGAGLRQIEAEAQRMGLLVSDLLDLARRDAGRLELRCQPLDLEETLLAVHERLAPAAAGRLQLRLSASSAALPPAMADSERLQQCLSALIDNALRYSPAPAPVQLFADADGDVLVVHVRDRGPGVPSDEQERIFERFVRGSTSAETRGSGLGLAIVRLLIEAMNGCVAVRSAPGGGSDFQLRLNPAADRP